ncbi:hypothetical protein Mucpa_2187 [Mucilaginibacter paludis DSM 18603]|uniref:Uncharacterized protein n=1 Tax=Mucilaginibacter paludis DSM 18603 TaxID=714943 RepID=H1YG37_9SPHI|nr:hypothetical protein Mucpa_2187 [Mucilaginibacter paludis DSM 18603]
MELYKKEGVIPPFLWHAPSLFQMEVHYSHAPVVPTVRSFSS